MIPCQATEPLRNNAPVDRKSKAGVVPRHHVMVPCVQESPSKADVTEIPTDVTGLPPRDRHRPRSRPPLPERTVPAKPPTRPSSETFYHPDFPALILISGTDAHMARSSSRESGHSLPPAYSFVDGLGDNRFLAPDPRQTSTQSLTPSFVGGHDTETRRTLLVVYIHGFYGNDQSFQSFPAHVHNYLKNELSDSYVIHSKIYPRYKTYKAITLARDNFSSWLQPHESPTTDIVLVGHSMGGLLAADVALMPNRDPYSSHPLKHRLLGTISLDSPFLGLHPGIIVSGISSLFRSNPSPPETPEPGAGPSTTLSPILSGTTSPEPSQYDSTTSINQFSSIDNSSTTSISPQPSNDPFFNPSYFNDVPFREQPFKKRLLHFVKKHSSEGVIGAARNHVLSHLEYGGCLADYPALNSRYSRIRALEDVDELHSLRQQSHGPAASQNQPVARVRFVNYYTISTGRPKKDKTRSHGPSRSRSPELDTTTDRLEAGSMEDRGSLAPLSMSASVGDVATPGIRLAEPSGVEEKLLSPTEGAGTQDNLPPAASMQHLDPFPESSEVGDSEHAVPGNSSLSQLHDDSTADLPAIPDLPPRPATPDLDACPDKDSRRQAEKEIKRDLKTYEQAVKNREKAIKERQKLADKRRKKAEKDTQKSVKEAGKAQAKAFTREQAQREAEAEQRRQEAEQRAKEAADREREAAERDGRPMPAPEPQEQQQQQQQQQPYNEQCEADTDVTDRGREESPSRGRTTTAEREARAIEAKKPAKERKFCVLPRRVSEGKDDTWVSIFMEGVDEVGAHCGLFFPGTHYEGLVGNVGQRVVEWAQESLSNRAILELAQTTDDLRLD
ncbi:hypothetical protein VDGD_08523 [Verticillium dahliae]|nr:40S ribosomal protein S8 [Verticillium dahliae VDG1]RBQ85128.1 hypothetical protein VDGD_08523 [Verticillium dahliae]